LIKVSWKGIELFSGIGAQKRGIDLTGLFDCDIIATSEIDKEAMVSYAAIHCGLTQDLVESYDKYPTKEEMSKLLTDRNIGYDFKKSKPYNWVKHIKQKNKTLEKYYLACVLSHNLGDISRIESLPYADFVSYSFPCQDLSVAGKGAGIKKGTRSGLLLEVERLLELSNSENTKPKFLLLENVKNLVGKENKPDFDRWLSKLDELGYNTYWKVINGKNCGVPQNRERTFAISIRKDIDTGLFEFNKPFDNGLRLKDLLDEVVEDKYYIKEDKLSRFITELNSKESLLYDSCQVKREGKSREYNDYAPTLTSRDYKDPRLVNDNMVKRIGQINSSQDGLVIDPNGISPTHTAGHGNCPKIIENNIIQLGNYRETSGGFDNPQTGRVYSASGISPTLNTMQGGDRQPKILEDFPLIAASRGRYDNNKKLIQNIELNKKGTSNTLTTVQKDNLVIGKNLRVRKLTPTECFRLMGFTDNDIKLCMEMGISDSQLYKEAGNSIITYCIMLIAEHLYKSQYNNTYICTDEIIINGDAEGLNFTQPQVG
jgi:DNA (cytosine-5)-methyltransferase 1